MRRGITLPLIFSALLAATTGPAASLEPRVRLEVSPREATVGDRLHASLSVWLPPDVRLEAAAIGPRLGAFTVDDEAWSGPAMEAGGQRWTWSGSLVCFRTGEMVLPAIRIEFSRADGSTASAESAAVPVIVRSVLDPQEIAEGEAPEPADLKPPASLEPDYTGLRNGAALAALLLAVSAAAWWLRRRLAAKLARVELPEDPFHHVPPHIWVREALQKLLERRLVEQGRHGRFFTELARIVKLYLGSRYRVDLIERTSGEVPGVLEQARTPGGTIALTRDLLDLADRVKFAGERPEPQTCLHAVDRAQAIVEATRPRDESGTPVARGAA